MKRHRLDPFSLIFGLTFAGLGGVLLNPDVDVVDFAGGGWVPIPLVLAGLFLLAVGIDRARAGRSEPPAEDEPPEA